MMCSKVTTRIVVMLVGESAACFLIAATLHAQLLADPPTAWPAREEIDLVSHKHYEGLIESEDANWLTLVRMVQPPGEKTHLVVQPFDRNQIVSMVRLEGDQRSRLQRQIDEFRSRLMIESIRMESIRLESFSGEGQSYRHYGGKWFTLDSTADEQSTRRAVVRAEQIFAAYRQILAPRTTPPRPPRLLVLGSLAEYQAVQGKLGLKAKIENRACFLEDRNVVLIDSELSHVATLAKPILAQNIQLQKDLSDLDRRLNDRLRAIRIELQQENLPAKDIGQALTRERAKFEKQLAKKRDEARQSDQKLARIFNDTAGQAMTRLYHESFHAYLRNYVYPSERYEVPYWLNEGLAVIFEGGILDGSTLRVDKPNAAALKVLKADLDGSTPLSLEQLLTASEGQFVLTAEARSPAVDRYYVHAWGLAHYLVFEKQLLGKATLDAYLRREAKVSAVKRFESLVSMTLPDFERQWRDYVRSL